MSRPTSLLRRCLRSAIVGFTLLAPLTAAHAQQSMREREVAIAGLLATQKVCEQLSGYVKEMSPLAPAETGLVQAENADRKRLYEAMAGGLQMTPDKVGEARSARYSDRLKKGILREIVDARGNIRIWDGNPPDPREISAALRVVTLDGAEIREEPNDSAPVVKGNLPRFSAYTILLEENGWYKVTTSSPEQKELAVALGWISGKVCFPWNHSIVVEPTPLKGRKPALFFEGNSELKRLAGLPKEERERGWEQLAQNKDAVVGQEPIIDYTTQKRAFVMPVIAHESVEIDGRKTMMLEVGAPVGGENRRPSTKPEPKLEVIFVMDTTGSMGSYITELKRQIQTFAEKIANRAPNVKFGFIAYRDDPKKHELIRYRKKNFTPKLVSLGDFPAKLADVAAVSIITPDEPAETMFDGLNEAISGDLWSPLEEGMRVAIIIGDAPGHPKMENGRYGPHLRQDAKNNGVTLFSIFLEKSKFGRPEDDRLAIEQLNELTKPHGQEDAKKGATNPNLRVVNAKSDEFSSAFQDVCDSVLQFLNNPDKGKLVDAVAKPDARPSFNLVLNNAYLDYVRRSNTEEPPKFVQGWTTDKVLCDPSYSAFTPEVMLTRDQLTRLIALLETIRTSISEEKPLFERLQNASGLAVLNPAAVELGERFKLPANLNILPYKSQIMNFTDNVWENMGDDARGKLLREFEQKLDWYYTLTEDRREGKDNKSPVWKQLSATDSKSDPRDDVCLVPLYMLP